MRSYRITDHPVLNCQKKEKISFFYIEEKLSALKDEMISTALFANSIRTFGKHHKDKSAHGIFCANRQCAHFLVTAYGKSVKSCVTPIKEGMVIKPLSEIPQLPDGDTPIAASSPIPEIETEVFIMSGGPAGLSAAIDLAEKGVKVVIADDKNILGVKLGLQTHNFYRKTVSRNHTTF